MEYWIIGLPARSQAGQKKLSPIQIALITLYAHYFIVPIFHHSIKATYIN
jgi:hypothetical protein